MPPSSTSRNAPYCALVTSVLSMQYVPTRTGFGPARPGQAPSTSAAASTSGPASTTSRLASSAGASGDDETSGDASSGTPYPTESTPRTAAHAALAPSAASATNQYDAPRPTARRSF